MPKKKKKRGFGIEALTSAALGLVVAVIVVGVGALILGNMKSTTTDTNASRVFMYGLGSMETLGGQFNTIAIVVAGAVVLTILIVALGGIMRRD